MISELKTRKVQIEFFTRFILINYRIPILISVIIGILGCSKNVGNENRHFALEYFYGVNGKNGYMISSWSDEKARAEFTKYRRISVELDDTWQFLDEKIDVRDLGGTEYFIRYSVMFENKSKNEIFTIEESFYSSGDNMWEPFRLKSREFIINLNDSKKNKVQKSKTLWKGDCIE